MLLSIHVISIEAQGIFVLLKYICILNIPIEFVVILGIAIVPFGKYSHAMNHIRVFHHIKNDYTLHMPRKSDPSCSSHLGTIQKVQRFSQEYVRTCVSNLLSRASFIVLDENY